MDIDEVLKKRGLTFDELTSDERETLFSWMNSINKNQITVVDVRNYVIRMRDSVAQALTELDEVNPSTWLGILGLFIPFVGIVRKWYLDQRKLALEARLRNYILLEQMLSTPDRARAAVEKQVAAMAAGKTRK